MISFLLGVAAVIGSGYWLHKLTETMSDQTRLRFAGAALLLVTGGALIG